MSWDHCHCIVGRRRVVLIQVIRTIIITFLIVLKTKLEVLVGGSHPEGLGRDMVRVIRHSIVRLLLNYWEGIRRKICSGERVMMI